MSKIKLTGLSSHDQQQQQQQQHYHNVCDNKLENNKSDFEIVESTSSNSITVSASDTFIHDESYHFINAPIMNDIFTQEANFAVPIVNKTWTTQIIDTNSVLTPPIFSAPNNVCIKPTFDEDATHWPESNDLLELDHRYNSCLQNDLLHSDAASVILNNEANAESLNDLSAYIDTRRKPLISHKNLTDKSEYVELQRSQQQPQQQITQSARVSSDSESDFEDRNLSWLLNFKFDEFPHLSPDAAALNSKNKVNLDITHLNIQSMQKNYKKSNSCSPSIDSNQTTLCHKADALESPMKAGKKFEELVMEATSEMDCNEFVEEENVVIDDISFRMGKKPPFTYTELIEYALEDKGELTVSGIYQWISDRFPYYKSNDDRWKNSVRHNLSINPHFRKGAKASQGAGHLWTISSGDSAESVLAWEHKKQRLELFFKMESANLKRIQQHQLKQLRQDKQQQQQQQHQQRNITISNSIVEENVAKCFEDEAATAAEIITREMLQQNNTANCSQTHLTNEHAMPNRVSTTQFVQELPFNDLICEEELRRAAGQILNGIHREVEVQSVNSIANTNYQNVLMESEDYLCENVLQNSNYTNVGNITYGGTNHSINNISSQFNITEIDPMELGIQMSHHVENEEILFNDELGLNFFGYTVNSDIAT